MFNNNYNLRQPRPTDMDIMMHYANNAILVGIGDRYGHPYDTPFGIDVITNIVSGFPEFEHVDAEKVRRIVVKTLLHGSGRILHGYRANNTYIRLYTDGLVQYIIEYNGAQLTDAYACYGRAPPDVALNVPPHQQEGVAHHEGAQIPHPEENQAPQAAEPQNVMLQVPPEPIVPYQGGGPPPEAPHAPPPANGPNVPHQDGAQQEDVQPLHPAVPHQGVPQGEPQGEPQAHPAAAPGAFPHQGGNPPEDGAQPPPPAVHAQGEPQGAPQAPPAPGEAAPNDHPPQPANENAVAQHPDVQEHEDPTLLTLEVEPDGNLRVRDFPQ